MSPPLISIIVPSLNQRPFLEECLQSVLRQDAADFEVLVFDGGSTDGSVEILQRTRGLTDWYSGRDRGQAHAINKGLRRARGAILGFLNSDDLLLPGALHRVTAWFAAHPETDLLYGNAHYIDERSEVTGDYPTRDWDWKALHAGCFICQPAAFWSRRIFTRVGYLDESLHCSLDYDYWTRIGLAGGVVRHVDEYLACSRKHPSTKTRSRRATIFPENLRMQRKRLGYVHAQWWFEYLLFLKYESNRRVGRFVPNRVHHTRRLAQWLERLSSLGSIRRGYRIMHGGESEQSFESTSDGACLPAASVTSQPCPPITANSQGTVPQPLVVPLIRSEARRGRILVDLARLWPGGANGGIRIFVRELLAAARESSAGAWHFVILCARNVASEIDDFAGPDDEVWILGGESPLECRHPFTGILPHSDPDSARLLQADVVYCPLGISDFATPGIPRVSLAVDVVHRDFPATLPAEEIAIREQWFDAMVRKSFRIQCNSEWVAARLQHHFGVPPERLFVVYNAVQARFPDKLPKASGAPTVFLYPANAWAHKNHHTLLHAFADYRKRAGGRAWDLALTGHRDAAMQQIELQAGALELGASVHVLGLLPDNEYTKLWSRTGALVFPSLHEGFGIPVLEAMHLGIPVVTSRMTAIPEVAGEACLYVDPSDPRALADAMWRIQNDEVLRARLIAAGHERAGQFVLEREAQKLVEVLNAAWHAARTGGSTWCRRATEATEVVPGSQVTLTENDGTVLLCIDEPKSWDTPAPLTLIRGWCFNQAVPAVVAMQVHCATRITHGVYGLPRPDVAIAHNEAPGSEISGFALRLTCPKHEQRQIAIVAVLADARRIRLLDLNIGSEMQSNA